MAVALRDLNGIIDIVNLKVLKGDVSDPPRATAALEVARQCRGRVGPDLDAGAVGGVVHADVGRHDVLDDVVGARILAQRADGDAVGAVAEEGLDEDVGGVGLEGDTVWAGLLVKGSAREANAWRVWR